MMAVALVLVGLAAVSALLMSHTLHDQQRINHRRHELSRAYYAAESSAAVSAADRAPPPWQAATARNVVPSIVRVIPLIGTSLAGLESALPGCRGPLTIAVKRPPGP